MNSLIKHKFEEVEIDILAGSTIDEAIEYAIQFHKQHDCVVRFKFNSIPIIITNYYNDKEFLLKYFYYRMSPKGRD